MTDASGELDCKHSSLDICGERMTEAEDRLW
jgi:hypothetical protein